MKRLLLSSSIKDSNAYPSATYIITSEQVSDWLCMQFHFNNTWCTLLLWDPHNRLRLQYMYCNSKDAIILHTDSSKSSWLTIPGDLPSGQWRLEIMGATEPFNIDWQFGRGKIPLLMEDCIADSHKWASTDSSFTKQTLTLHYNTNEYIDHSHRWYRGDFHSHTVLSDGKMEPEQLMEQAELRQLDFFVATDHQLLTTGWPTGKPLVIPGMEITSHKGHFNALGLLQWLDWRPQSKDGGMDSEEGMNRLLLDAKHGGALRSLNHPELQPWDWKFRDTPIQEWDSIEIWNDPAYPPNREATEKALLIWSALWNEGYQLPGIGGSDVHGLPTDYYEGSDEAPLIGDPSTFVYATGLSCRSILDGVQKRHIYVSRGVILDCTILCANQHYLFGDCLVQSGDTLEVDYTLHISQATNGCIHWIEDGIEIFRQPFTKEGDYTHSFCWKSGEYHWRRAEIRTDQGKLLAFTNPIFTGSKRPEVKVWHELSSKYQWNLIHKEA